MRRRDLLVAGIGGVISSAAAQQRRQGQVAALMGTLAPEIAAPYVAMLRRSLAEHGFVEGENVGVRVFYATDRYGSLPALADEIVREGFDVIVANGGAATEAVAKATKDTAVVALTGDLVAMGLAASVARPGRNVTGLSIVSAELAQKNLQLLQRLRPGLSRVGALFVPTSIAEVNAVKRVREAAQLLGPKLESLQVRVPQEIAPALQTLASAGHEALLLVASTMIGNHFAEVAELAARHALPSISSSTRYPHAGGLVAYGIDMVDLYRQAGDYVARILRGAQPAEIPIDHPTKLTLALNLSTARRIGVVVPPDILVAADEVIE